MHIVFLIPTLDRIGGAERQVLLLATGFVRRNWQVSVIALSGTGGKAATDLRSQEVAFLSLQMRKGLADPRGWSQLRSWIKLHQPDVVHAHLPHAVLMARLSRLITPVRVLVETIHSPATGGQLRRFSYRFTAQQPDIVSAVSRTAAEPLLAKRTFHDAEVAIIPNGINLDHWKRVRGLRLASRQRLGLGNEFVWLTVGRLDPVKDHQTLLRAFSKISGNTCLIIAGTGPLERKLRDQAAELGLDTKVHFLGFQDDVLPWMQAADGFVMSSQWEGLPMAFLEASACELPSVFTDIPAMRELAGNRHNCPVVPAGNSDTLATAMTAIMQLSEPESRALGKAARRLVVERFSLNFVLDEWEQTYRALLALKPHPTRSGIPRSSSRERTLPLQ